MGEANIELKQAYIKVQSSRRIKIAAFVAKIGAFLGFAVGRGVASTAVGAGTGAVVGAAVGTVIMDKKMMKEEKK